MSDSHRPSQPYTPLVFRKIEPAVHVPAWVPDGAPPVRRLRLRPAGVPDTASVLPSPHRWSRPPPSLPPPPVAADPSEPALSHAPADVASLAEQALEQERRALAEEREALHAARAELDAAQAALRGTVEQLVSDGLSHVRELEEPLLLLSVEIARAIVDTELVLDPTRYRRFAEAGVEALPHASKARIVASPEAYEALTRPPGPAPGDVAPGDVAPGDAATGSAPSGDVAPGGAAPGSTSLAGTSSADTSSADTSSAGTSSADTVQNEPAGATPQTHTSGTGSITIAGATYEVLLDPNLEAAGCVVEAGRARVDTGLGARLEAVKEALIAEHRAGRPADEHRAGRPADEHRAGPPAEVGAEVGTEMGSEMRTAEGER